MTEYSSHAPREFEIAGRAVIVAGAGRGIGKGIARVLAESGVQVLATAMTETYLSQVAGELAAAGHPIEFMAADATSGDDMAGVVERALSRFGRLDGLVNCVGDAISKPIVPLPDSAAETTPLTDEEWRFILDVNLTEAFVGCRAVGAHFLSQRSGRVVNIAGYAAARGGANSVAYAAAKAGLTRMTQALALEWAPYGINVNAIAPGVFPDPVTSQEAVERAAARAASGQIPLRRPGNLREVGLLTHFLLSDAADYMTGETVFIDGGAVFG
ncbi:MAG: SDR family NAD(P)-dependent oxidoreductase [Chloroflexi bacterium]|nr:SDR family NAD(P)-dependent oxidoreductase [Chloroflexota bacterium]